MTRPENTESAQDGKQAEAPDKGERIAKAIARAGICSRREAERLIAEGRVAVDGRRLDSPAFNVTAANHVTVDGKALPTPAPPRLWRYHKPTGLITSARDPQGRPTVFAALPPELGRLLSVGRLDLNSEGLLLLTNDGGLKRRLELPASGWIRRYRARVYGRVDPKKLTELAQGVRVDGVDYGPIRAELERQMASNAWVSVALTEGKTREVRKILEHLGLAVNRLIRVAFGPFQLGGLPRGGLDEVPGKVLAEQLGEAGGGGGGRKIGTAKAKPKPTRPGGKKPGGRKPGGGKPGGRKPDGRKPGGRKFGGQKPGGQKPGGRKPKPSRGGPGKAGAKNANRRRPS
jgi:23S rRNA pseudouridine2605 synthase